MLHSGGPRLPITYKDSALLLERARIHEEGGRILYHIVDDDMRREFNIPHANLAVLFLGQGTSITQDAIRLLGEEGVHLAVTGSGGTPLHMGGLTNYTATRHFRDFLPLYLDPERSLPAAISVMRDRIDRMQTNGAKLTMKLFKLRDAAPIVKMCRQFDDDLNHCSDMKQLLGFEGQFAKACYKTFAELSGLSKNGTFVRDAGSGDIEKKDLEDPMRRVNRMIDHGNYLCYGIAGAGLWALGIPHHMAIFHGKTRAGGLVFDIADSFKDSLILPAAFASASVKDDYENTFRATIIHAFNDTKSLEGVIRTVERMIEVAGTGEVPDHA